MNDWNKILQFEESLCKYTGSKYAVAVDSCTNALFLSMKYCNVCHSGIPVDVPKRTYINVANSVIHAGGTIRFVHCDWSQFGFYNLFPYPIIDSACLFTSNMYIPGTFYCVSFQARKTLKLGKGGAILHDNKDADKWFREVRLNGRANEPKYIGYNMYMTPEQAYYGYRLLMNLPRNNQPLIFDYPDLSGYKVYEDFSHGQ